MKYIKGNIIELFDKGYIDVVVHGCNCFHTMGAGLAKQIKQRYPAAYAADLSTPKGDKNKLGTYSFVTIGINRYIVNAYTQYYYGRYHTQLDYSALQNVMYGIKKEFGVLRVGIPKIGCGHAKGHWPTVEEIIDRLGFRDITCILL